MRHPFPVDERVLRALERHETLSHALPAREVRDLGDALLLTDPLDADPFWNRLASIRWPEGSSAFDARLAEAIVLFGVLDRRPHIWPSPVHNRPADLVARLAGHGFRDTGAGHLMVLAEPAAAPPVRAEEMPPGVTVELVHRVRAADAIAAEAAGVLADAFEADLARLPDFAADLARGLTDPRIAIVLVRLAGEPAAVAKATTFDGATYLSSIGTRAAFRGRRLAALATRTAIAHGRTAGVETFYLGVFSGNEPAIRVYERLGFASVGEAPDLVLA